jgi:hypothetical protein
MSDHPAGVKSNNEFYHLQLRPVTGALSGIEAKKFDKLI